ncbi:SPOR domain-containing protein [Galenea microaerophila]
MAQTISELEKERAELLKKIEEEARLAKQKTGQEPLPTSDSENSDNLTLNDFLMAAQEVIPDDATPLLKDKESSTMKNSRAQTQKGQVGQSGQAAQTTADTSSNGQKSTFFGVVIMLTLLLTVIGVMGLVYITLKESIDQLDKTTQSQKESVVEIANELKALKAQPTSNESIQDLKQKVESLEQKVMQLEQKIDDMEAQPVAQSADIPQLNISGDTVITADLLDQKFSLYTKYLEQKLDRKFDLILQYLIKGKANPENTQPASERPTQSDITNTYQLPKQVKSPKTPEVKAPQSPQSAQTIKPTEPVVTLVKPATTVKAPETPSAYFTKEVKWLTQQPLLNYTLQLASLADKSSLERFKQRKKLESAKIIPQKNGKSVRYVLIIGSYATRNEAQNQARKIKQQTGISPWMRQIKALTSRLP